MTAHILTLSYPDGITVGVDIREVSHGINDPRGKFSIFFRQSDRQVDLQDPDQR